MTLGLDGDRLVLAFPYDEAMIAEVKAIPGRRWDSETRTWTFPLSAVATVRAFAEAHGIAVDPGIGAVEILEEAPAVSVAGGRFVIGFPYDPDLVARVREIPDARWDVKRRVWTAPLEAETEVAQFVVDTGAAVAPSADDLLPHAREALATIIASMAPNAHLEVPGLGGDLMPFQRAGVAYTLDRLES